MVEWRFKSQFTGTSNISIFARRRFHTLFLLRVAWCPLVMNSIISAIFSSIDLISWSRKQVIIWVLEQWWISLHRTNKIIETLKREKHRVWKHLSLLRILVIGFSTSNTLPVHYVHLDKSLNSMNAVATLLRCGMWYFFTLIAILWVADVEKLNGSNVKIEVVTIWSKVSIERGRGHSFERRCDESWNRMKVTPF